MLTFYPSRIPDPGVKKAPDPDPQHWCQCYHHCCLYITQPNISEIFVPSQKIFLFSIVLPTIVPANANLECIPVKKSLCKKLCARKSTRTSVADPHHLMRIRIPLFTLMWIQIRLCEPLRLLNFDFDADPDPDPALYPAFHSDVDPDLPSAK